MRVYKKYNLIFENLYTWIASMRETAWLDLDIRMQRDEAQLRFLRMLMGGLSHLAVGTSFFL